MSSLEIDPSISEPEDQNDADEDDIEVWKDVHMSLTLTIMKLQDSIAMRKAQRRFILETIVRHVPPLPEIDSTDEAAIEGVPSNPANPNWLDDPLCGSDIFDSEKIAEIMKLQSSSRSARTTISSSVSHWVRNSNTNYSASNFLRATDAETSTGRSNNSGKQKKANNKGGKNCKPKANSKSYRKEDLQSEDEVPRGEEMNADSSSDDNLNVIESVVPDCDYDSVAERNENTPKKKSKKKKKKRHRDNDFDETELKKLTKKKKKKSKDSKLSSEASKSTKKKKKKKKKSKEINEDEFTGDETESADEIETTTKKKKKKLTLKLKLSSDAQARENNAEYTDSEDEQSPPRNRESNSRERWDERSRSNSYDSFEESSNQNPYRRILPARETEQYGYRNDNDDVSIDEEMTDDIEKCSDQDEDFGF
eukprot:CAMPEP_0194289410 /NCGR_PEP_ID=MMETSP0169-20130528/38968_1 /TAXON_ID=218684 /ORGANISM="Corethron pennatum, Strain L29A3" /LENGTH=421 /DNA_ID=CAMNT_0039036677 /DNA_START=122 /DNA_END=1387 /DNA_ORIENTATION=+